MCTNFSDVLRHRARLTLAVPLALCLAMSPAEAQTMKVKDEGSGKKDPPFCRRLPLTDGTMKSTMPQQRISGGTAKKTLPSPSLALTPAADATWKMLGGSSISYCVRVGVINDGATASVVPLTLVLSDDRPQGDPSYVEDYAPALVPPQHVMIASRSGTISTPVPGNGYLDAGSAWCNTLSDWRRRPRLWLTLTSPSLSEPVSCRVVFPNTQRP